MIATDYVGIGTLVTATAAALVTVIVAWRQTGTKRQVDEVHAAVSTSNGETLAGTVEKIDRNTETAATTSERTP